MVLGKNDFIFTKEHNVFHGQLAHVRDAMPVDNRTGVPFDMLATPGPALRPDEKPRETPEPGIFSVGRLTQDQWYEELSMSKVMIGLGMPALSPSRKCSAAAAGGRAEG